ncbi:hypothetical protein QJS10_CPB22g01164 [Acorus calamus]|uniref:SprT-like domain-containing protein n=1 Tax=Acorus calamus TaxID=4465 RepID=A0AAV9C1V0_ACOCL|nr:hypothetical protein QJS10_CPB22g01164 [Acorus calamus]
MAGRSPDSCRYPPKYDPAILLSESDFKFRPSENLKNILLHEMIHAYLFMKHGITDRNKHDLLFETLMDGINSNFLIDQERPIAGYNIIFRHLLNQDVERNRDNHWICELCGDLIKRGVNREPSANDCIEKAGGADSCAAPLCYWHM